MSPMATSYGRTYPEDQRYFRTTASVAGHASQTASVIDSACEKILEGDFKAAKQLIDRSTVSNSQDLETIRNIIDDYTAIKARRKDSQNKVYKTQTDKLNELRQKSFPDDAKGIEKVFTLILNISEYADEKQTRSLLKDPLLTQAVRKAKAEAAVLEAQGKWIDAYTICYSNLTQIYRDNDAYSDHADQLLEKADILASLQDSPCQTRRERYAGILKEMFTNAVDILDTGYVNIIDYRQMAIKGMDRCQLSAEVMTRLDAGNEYRMTNAQYTAWSNGLEKIARQIDRSQIDMDKNDFTDVLDRILELNRSSHDSATLPDAVLITQFTKGSMSTLDPYTAIYWPSQVQDFKKAITNQFSGIGIKF